MTSKLEDLLKRASKHLGIPAALLQYGLFIALLLYGKGWFITGLLVGILWFSMMLRSNSPTVLYIVRKLGAEWYAKELKKRPHKMPRSIKEAKSIQPLK